MLTCIFLNLKKKFLKENCEKSAHLLTSYNKDLGINQVVTARKVKCVFETNRRQLIKDLGHGGWSISGKIYNKAKYLVPTSSSLVHRSFTFTLV